MEEKIQTSSYFSGEVDANGKIIEIPVQQIVANRYQPRLSFEETELQELSSSIKTHGLLQPIIVRKVTSDIFEIVAGERRYRAAKLAGFTVVPAIVKDIASNDAAILALVENVQRSDLNVIEEAKSYAQLSELFNKTQNEIAEMVGRSQSAVANKLRLLNLTEDVQKAIEQKLITERHGRALLKIKEDEIQIKILQLALTKKFNVAELERYIENYLENKNNRDNSMIFFNVAKDTKLAVNTINKAVKTIKDFGMDLDYTREETADTYILNIVIPKNVVETKAKDIAFPHEKINIDSQQEHKVNNETPATVADNVVDNSDQNQEKDKTAPIILDLDLTSELSLNIPKKADELDQG
jgi:ParB-like partition proteins